MDAFIFQFKCFKQTSESRVERHLTARLGLGFHGRKLPDEPGKSPLRPCVRAQLSLITPGVFKPLQGPSCCEASSPDLSPCSLAGPPVSAGRPLLGCAQEPRSVRRSYVLCLLPFLRPGSLGNISLSSTSSSQARGEISLLCTELCPPPQCIC